MSYRNPDRWNSVNVPARVAERAYTRRSINETGCWISSYSVASHGYAQIGWNDSAKTHMVLAHRASWVHINGQVPLGMTLDHVCKTKQCVNPEHLRLLPNFENARRVYGKDWPIGECANGHSPELLVPVSTTDKKGDRRKGLACAACKPLYNARWEWRKKNPGEPLPVELLLRSERDAA